MENSLRTCGPKTGGVFAGSAYDVSQKFYYGHFALLTVSQRTRTSHDPSPYNLIKEATNA
eukprot:2301261-Pleurochrysis_carterae.AAC.2